MRQATLGVRGLRRAGAILAVAALVGVFAAPTAAQETLVGETFTGDPGAQDAFVNCSTGSGSMVAQGAASGPVPGTFLEFVDYAFEPVSGTGTGALTAFTADFVIRDALTNEVLARGFKTLIAGTTDCNSDTQRTVTNASVNYFVDFPPFGEPGAFDEQGTATVVLVDDGPDVLDAFVEQFGAGDAVVTEKQQCKKGGWRDRTRADGTGFKNQGECIHYVNTGA